MKKKFFLGGADAEMAEIKKLLVLANQETLDKGLGWGAKASVYAEEISAAASVGKTPVLVELEIDIELPAGTIVVDHHAASAPVKPASILQVLSLLGLEPTRSHKLVAANDSGYIPAMLALGATAEEISAVRFLDREAQGITPEQETEAKRAIACVEVNGRLTVVRMNHSKTATVSDRLFGQYDQLLIISSDGEVNFYGDGALCSELKEKFQGWAGGAGLGQKGRNAYWGGYPNHDEVLNFIVEKVGS